MLIRLLTQSDAKQFWNLRLRALKEHPEAFGAAYEEESEIPLDELIARFKNNLIQPIEENFMLGAFNDAGDMVGVVGFRREHREKLRHKASIWGMYVATEQRQSGIGRLLLTELMKKASLLEGLEQISLGVVSSNDKAKKLYSSLGFSTYGIEKNALKIGEQYFDEDIMVIFMN